MYLVLSESSLSVDKTKEEQKKKKKAVSSIFLYFLNNETEAK